MTEEPKNVLDLWQLFSRLKRDGVNTALRLLGPVVGFAIGFYIDPHGLTKLMADFSAVLAGIWASLLGFVIAGYAIFTTSLDPKFMLALWQFKEPNSGLSHLQVRLLIFSKLFLYLLLGLMVFLGIYSISILVPHLPLNPSPSLKMVYRIMSLGVAGFAVSTSLVELKSLIFNLYDLALTQARKLEIDSKQKNSSKE